VSDDSSNYSGYNCVNLSTRQLNIPLLVKTTNCLNERCTFCKWKCQERKLELLRTSPTYNFSGNIRRNIRTTRGSVLTFQEQLILQPIPTWSWCRVSTKTRASHVDSWLSITGIKRIFWEVLKPNFKYYFQGTEQGQVRMSNHWNHTGKLRKWRKFAAPFRISNRSTIMCGCLQLFQVKFIPYSSGF